MQKFGEYTVNTLTQLKNALENSSNGDTIQLTADITGVSSEIEIIKKITLDLNGHTISGSLGDSSLIRNSADLTVTDSSTGGTGKIENTDSMSGSGIFNDSGKLTIIGGTFSGSESAICNIDGTLEISGGTFLGKCFAIGNIDGTVEISGGTFNEDVSEISGVIIAEGYKVTNNGDTWTVSESVAEITKTKEIDGVTVTFTFDGSNNLTKVEGTGVTYSNGKFTIGNKTYSASLSNDTVTETLESAVYTKTINGVAVTFTFDGSSVLQSVTGTGVTYSNGKFTVGNKTYSASLSGDTITETLESTTYTKTIDGVAVTFTYNASNVLQSVTGEGVTYSDGKFTVGNKTYSASLSGDTVTETLESVAPATITPIATNNNGTLDDGLKIIVDFNRTVTIHTYINDEESFSFSNPVNAPIRLIFTYDAANNSFSFATSSTYRFSFMRATSSDNPTFEIDHNVGGLYVSYADAVNQGKGSLYVPFSIYNCISRISLNRDENTFKVHKAFPSAERFYYSNQGLGTYDTYDIDLKDFSFSVSYSEDAEVLQDLMKMNISDDQFLGFAANGITIPCTTRGGDLLISSEILGDFSYKISDILSPTHKITIDNHTYSVAFDDSGNIIRVNGIALNNGKVTLNDTEYTFSGTTESITYEEVLPEIITTKTIDGVTVTFTFDGSTSDLKNAEGTGVTYDTSNKQFTIAVTGKTKIYSASLSNDTVTATLESAVYTKTINGVAVTFTFDGSSVLQSVTGTGVTYSNGKFTIGNKTYSASLSNDTVTATLESAVYTKTINGVAVTFTFDGSSVLQSVTGTGVTYSNGKFTIGNKTYSASLSNDTVTETLESAVYTKTINSVAVTFTFNGSNALQSVTGTGVTYSGGKFTIGNKTYSASLNNDTVTETLESATYTVDNVEVIVNFDTQGKILSVTGNGVAYDENNSSITISDSIYKLKLENNEVIFNTVIVFDSGAGEDSTTTKSFTNSGDNLTAQINAGSNSLTDSGNNTTMNIGGGENTVTSSGDNAQLEIGGGTNNLKSSGDNANINLGKGENTVELSGKSSSVTVGGGTNNLTSSGANANIDLGGGTNTIELNGDSSNVNISGGNNNITSKSNGLNLTLSKTLKLSARTEMVLSGDNTKVDIGGGTNTIELNGDSSNVSVGGGTNNITSSGNNANINLGNGKNTLELSGNSPNVSVGGGKNNITITDNESNTETDFTFTLLGGNNEIRISCRLPDGTPTARVKFDGGVTNLVSWRFDNKKDDRSRRVLSKYDNLSITDLLFGIDSETDSYTNADDTGFIVSFADNPITSTKVKGNDVQFIATNGKFTFEDALGLKIHTEDAEGNITTQIFSENAVFNFNNDEIKMFSNFSGTMTANSEIDNIDATASKKSFQIVANDNDNSIQGGSGKNTLNGGAGDDTLTGGAGKDVFVYESGNDIITDYAAGDKISLASGTIDKVEIVDTDLIFTIGSGTLTIKDGAGKEITVIDSVGAESKRTYTDGFSYNENNTAMTINSSASGTINVASKVQTIDATAVTKPITLIGNSKANTIQAGKSAITIDGGAGNDLIYGGTGNDSLFGGEGNDTLSGGDGKDIFVYSGGKDVIVDFTAGQDSISLASGTVTDVSLKNSDMVFKTSSGTLTVKNGKDKEITIGDSIYYNENIVYDLDKTTLTLGKSFKGSLQAADYNASTKTIDASNVSRSVNIAGNNQSNTITGGTKDDTLNGGAGNDTLTGGKGDDIFIYSSGNDVITDYAAGDKISLASGTIDKVAVVSTDLIFTTGSGTLTIKDGVNKEITVIDSVGAESKKTYTDEFSYNENNTAMTINSSASGTISIASKVQTIDATAVTNPITLIGNSKANTIQAGKGAITIDGGAGNDLIFGGTGNDSLFGGEGNDTLTGGDGKDVFVYSGGKDVIVDFTAGQDSISLASGTVTDVSFKNSDMVFKTSSGTLTVKNGKDKEITIGDSIYYNENIVYDLDKTTLTLGKSFKGSLQATDYNASTKTIDASNVSHSVNIAGNNQSNTITGGTKADTIYGGAGNDSISGNAGNDKLYGGAGNDTLTGGAGKDVFVYESGNDTITDYTAGQDKITFSSKITKTSYSGNDLIFTTEAGNLTVLNAAGAKITVTYSDGKTSTKVYSSTSAKTLDLFFDNNFITEDVQISEITQEKESNYVTGQTEILKNANEFSVNDSIVSSTGFDKK